MYQHGCLLLSLRRHKICDSPLSRGQGHQTGRRSVGVPRQSWAIPLLTPFCSTVSNICVPAKPSKCHCWREHSCKRNFKMPTILWEEGKGNMVQQYLWNIKRWAKISWGKCCWSALCAEHIYHSRLWLSISCMRLRAAVVALTLCLSGY